MFITISGTPGKDTGIGVGQPGEMDEKTLRDILFKKIGPYMSSHCEEFDETKIISHTPPICELDELPNGRQIGWEIFRNFLERLEVDCPVTVYCGHHHTSEKKKI